MPTLTETIARRKRARMAGKALTPEAIISMRDLASILDEFEQLRDQIYEAISAAKAAHKGDKGDQGEPAVVDYAAIVSEVLRRIPRPQDGNDAEPVDERGILARVLALVPPPEKGEPGEPGLAAEVDHDQLAEAMLAKIAERKIPAEHVDGIGKIMERHWQRIRGQFPSGFSGGGDVVVAGSNVTITRLTNGQRQISASSGSLTTLAATETPNSVLTVFTFASAAAQPSYIRADNVWMKATSASGTVNWTWNAGAKQATMAVAPQDDIEAIV